MTAKGGKEFRGGRGQNGGKKEEAKARGDKAGSGCSLRHSTRREEEEEEEVGPGGFRGGKHSEYVKWRNGSFIPGQTISRSMVIYVYVYMYIYAVCNTRTVNVSLTRSFSICLLYLVLYTPISHVHYTGTANLRASKLICSIHMLVCLLGLMRPLSLYSD